MWRWLSSLCRVSFSLSSSSSGSHDSCLRGHYHFFPQSHSCPLNELHLFPRPSHSLVPSTKQETDRPEEGRPLPPHPWYHLSVDALVTNIFLKHIKLLFCPVLPQTLPFSRSIQHPWGRLGLLEQECMEKKERGTVQLLILVLDFLVHRCIRRNTMLPSYVSPLPLTQNTSCHLIWVGRD